MTKKLFISTILIAFLSGNLLSESIEEIIVLEKIWSDFQFDLQFDFRFEKIELEIELIGSPNRPAIGIKFD